MPHELTSFALALLLGSHVSAGPIQIEDPAVDPRIRAYVAAADELTVEGMSRCVNADVSALWSTWVAVQDSELLDAEERGRGDMNRGVDVLRGALEACDSAEVRRVTSDAVLDGVTVLEARALIPIWIDAPNTCRQMPLEVLLRAPQVPWTDSRVLGGCVELIERLVQAGRIDVVGLYHESSGSAQSAVVLGMRAGKPERFMDFLLDRLDEPEAPHAELATAIGALGARSEVDARRALVDRILSRIDSIGEGPLEVALIRALGRIGEDAAVEALVVLIEGSETKATRREAWNAAKRITHTTLPNDGRVWNEWLRSQRAWYDSEAFDLMDSALSVDAAHATQGLRLLGMRPIGRTQFSEIALRALDHYDPRVRVEACRTIDRLDQVFAVESLLEVLEDPEPEVQKAARLALEARGMIESSADGL